eukprot:scaffold10217_cov223-Chaetoceros_neogracile.AAC.3
MSRREPFEEEIRNYLTSQMLIDEERIPDYRTMREDGQYKDLEGGNLVMIPGHHIQSCGFIRPLTLWWLDRGKGRIKF